MGRVTVQWTGPTWALYSSGGLPGMGIYNRATSLSLFGASYDDTAVEHLVRLRRLESLTLSNTGITDAGVERLRRALPGCRIERRAL
jgi:hypothetical protein